MEADRPIAIEVAYALPDRQDIVRLKVPAGTTVSGAIGLSGLAARHPALAGEAVATGVHGRRVPGETVLSEGDRVEIYRPLVADPKQARRRRAARRPE